ncbi:MAG: hypothetical protein KA403_02130 [Candidatus Omnitrophica bacterium]|nr:hypothetical protein [Candidatus Omnitrophota bacterium]
MSILETISLICAVIMPLFNIPLILKILKRKSSQDISLVWALGIWICILLMAPSGFQSKDIVWRTFNITNMILFTAVVIVVLKYHKKADRGLNE